jgi:hypothetical protein
MAISKCQWNEFLIFVNKYKTARDKKSEYFGQGNLEGEFVYLYADIFRGEKVTFLQGKVINKYLRKEVGRFKVWPNKCNSENNIPKFKGWLKVGLHVDYELSIWMNESKGGERYMKGNFKIKDAESLYKEEAMFKASAPTVIDYQVF